MREGIPVVIVISLLFLLRVLVPPLEISYMGYHEGFMERMKEGDRGYLLNSPGPNSSLMENFQYIYNLPYVTDMELYGLVEYFASAEEFFAFKAGDCEDKAIALASSAYHLGEPYNQTDYVKVVFGSVDASTIEAAPLSSFIASYYFGHAWVEIGHDNVTVYDPTLGIIMGKEEYYRKFVVRFNPDMNARLKIFWFSWHSSGFE
jgi:transglutaminase-like putative cysteine protease